MNNSLPYISVLYGFPYWCINLIVSRSIVSSQWVQNIIFIKDLIYDIDPAYFNLFRRFLKLFEYTVSTVELRGININTNPVKAVKFQEMWRNLTRPICGYSSTLNRYKKQSEHILTPNGASHDKSCRVSNNICLPFLYHCKVLCGNIKRKVWERKRRQIDRFNIFSAV